MERFTPFDRLFQSCGRIWHIRRADMDKLWAAMDEKEWAAAFDRANYGNVTFTRTFTGPKSVAR